MDAHPLPKNTEVNNGDAVAADDVMAAQDPSPSQLVLLQKMGATPPTDKKTIQKIRTDLEKYGEQALQAANYNSQMLKSPMSTFQKDASNGELIAKALDDLQAQGLKVNPSGITFEMSTVRRWLSRLPGVGTPLEKWFRRYQTAESVIKDCVAALKEGGQQLERDNCIISEDLIAFQCAAEQLQLETDGAKYLRQALDNHIRSHITEPSEKERWQSEYAFALNQRIIDLQQALAVFQQGILTAEVLVKNNKELIRSVKRSMTVTQTAIQVAATLAIALQNQKQVLRTTQSINRATSQLLQANAQQLSTQASEIQTQASQSVLNVDELKNSFGMVVESIDATIRFRINALSEMGEAIDTMSKLNDDMDSRIQSNFKASS